MTFNTFAISYSIVLFIGVIICLKIGHAMGRRHTPHEQETGGSNAIDAALFALLGLFFGFTFSSALDSYGEYRNLLTKEANDIAIVYRKVDLFPLEKQPELRLLMQQYAQVRLEATEATMNSPTEQEALVKSTEIQNQIWKNILELTNVSETLGIAMVDSFNIMANAPDDQLAEQRNKTPPITYILIILLSLLSAVIAGYGMADYPKIPSMRIVIFATAVAITMYVVIDLAHPRSGFFNAVTNNYMLIDVIKTMH